MINISKPKLFILPRKIESNLLVNWIITDENGDIIIDWDRLSTVIIPLNQPNIQNPDLVNPYDADPILPNIQNPDLVNPYAAGPIWTIRPNDIWYSDNLSIMSSNTAARSLII